MGQRQACRQRRYLRHPPDGSGRADDFARVWGALKEEEDEEEEEEEEEEKGGEKRRLGGAGGRRRK